MNLERTIWRYRPLSKGLLTYAALDIEMIWLVKEALEKHIPLLGIKKEQIEIASERYTKIRRDFEKPDDFYIKNAILPCYVIPKISGSAIEPFPDEDKKCRGCKRMLTSLCIVNGSCEDCREVDRASRYRY